VPVGLLLETLLLAPLLTVFEVVFQFWKQCTPTLGFALIAFSLTINLILAPIYAEMERAQAAQSARRSKIRGEVERMRKHFRGRERYFYIRTVYRHYNHSPALALVGSGSLLLQMLVFFTAYRYLRDHPQLEGVAFGGIPSLSEPDGLIWGFNALPVLMTAANIASALLHGSERSQRIQACLLAALFLVLLYDSPAGLLVYWTTNNVVSLLRNLGRPLWERAWPSNWRARFSRLADLE
jgi:membrane protein insertase Oxa1/YidC/SpoIIIJ